MTCKRCNNELPDNARFCMACGALQPMICPSCQAESRPGSRTCSGCGKKLPLPADSKITFYKRKKTPGEIVGMALLGLGCVLVVTASVWFLTDTLRNLRADEQISMEQPPAKMELELTVEEPVKRDEPEKEENKPSVEIAEDAMVQTDEQTEEQTEETAEETAQEQTEQTEETAEEQPQEESTGKKEWFFPDSSERLLTNADIAGMSTAEMKIARNEIFARHGRRFNNPDLQKWFDSCSWYKGTIAPKDFDENIFNATELANIKFLYAAEGN